MASLIILMLGSFAGKILAISNRIEFQWTDLQSHYITKMGRNLSINISVKFRKGLAPYGVIFRL